MKGFTLFLLLFFWQINTFSQSQNPPDILWNRLESEHFKVIYPSEIEPEAQRIINTLEWVYNYDTKSLNIKPKPISVVLYNRTTNSNAYAALAPRRMGWYLCPPQSVTSLGSTNWVQTLALHEYRHVVQYAKNRQNFTKIMSVLYGDIGQNTMRWSIPDWFFEGDAIVAETAFTKGGRGRMPEFFMNIRTYAIENEKFTYDQAYLGSYKRFYPSHYHLGYPLTAYSRMNYGKDVWDKVLQRTSKISFWPFAFGSSLKKYTGKNIGKSYKSATQELAENWKNQNSDLNITEVKIINRRKKRSWTNYFNPTYDENGNIFVGKESLQKISAFYSLTPDGTEKKLKNTDAEIFNLNRNFILWESIIPDIRFDEQAFSDIIMFDIKNRKQKRITDKERYLSPALSPDGTKIVAVEYKQEQKYYLVILDATSGKQIDSQSVGNNDYIITPVWSADGKFIAFTHSKFNGSALSIVNIQTKELKKILDYNYENIGRPVFYGNYILYNSGYSGINNIYAVEINTGSKFQVTSRPYGAFNANVSPDKSKIVFQDYSKNGFNVAEMELKPEKWIRIEDIKPFHLPYFQTLVEQEGKVDINQSRIPETSYPVAKYNTFKDAVKIHSWGFFPYEPNLEFSIYSGNYLNTLTGQLGYLYNINENTNTGFLSISYSKYFPVFSLVSSYGQRRETYSFINGDYEDLWEEMNNTLSISFPINLSRGVYFRKLTLNGAYGYLNIKNRDYTPDFDLPNGGFSVLWGGLKFSNNMQYAWRDFSPKWGQNLAFDYKQIPENSGYKGYLLSGRANFYFPGIMPQNSLKLSGAYEKQTEYIESERNSLYYFSSMSAFPRGYTAYTFDEIYKLSIDYQFPLWYPDINFGPIIYFKRLKMGGFFDYAKGSWGNLIEEYQSVGGSLSLEFKLLRVNYPFEIGVEFAHRLTDGQNEISLLILGLPF